MTEGSKAGWRRVRFGDVHLAPTLQRHCHLVKNFPFALSLSKGERETLNLLKLSRTWFDKLTTNGLTKWQ